MSTLDQLKKIKADLKKEYREKLEAINRMIDVFGEPEQQGISDTERTKQALEHYEDRAYKITELMHMLEMEGISVTRSILHQALKQLRDKGTIKAFRINGSNQSVYYMSPEGIDRSNPSYPVRADYRPDDVDPDYVKEFEWLD